MLEYGDIALLRSWIEELPASVVLAHPRLFLSSAWLLLLTNQIDVAEMQLRDAKKILAARDDAVPSLSPENAEDGKCLRAERDTDEAMREGFWGEVAAIAATITLARQEVPLAIEQLAIEQLAIEQLAIEQCHHALKHLSTDNFYVRGLLFVLLGQAYRVSGDLGAASQALAEAYTTSHVAGNVFLTVGAMVNLAEIYEMQGQLHQAARTRRQVIGLANTPDGRPLPFAGPAYIGMGKLLREWNDLQAATEYLTKGSELCQQGGIEGNVFDAFITLAFVWQALGDTKRAFEFLQQAQSLARRLNTAWADARIEAFRARLHLVQGNIEPALRWVMESGLHVGDLPSDGLEVEYLTMARVLLASGRAFSNGFHLEQAMELFGRLLSAAERAGRNGNVIEIQTLQASALHAQGDASAARTYLWRALSLAEPQGYVRLFVDEDQPLQLLLKAVVKQSRRARHSREPGCSRQYLRTLLAAFGPEMQPSSQHASNVPPVQPLLDPVSERELVILRLVAAGRKNQEIADELVIALGTVKTHIQSLYRKLDVTNRAQAVSRAQALKLL